MYDFQLALLQCLDDIEKQDAHQLFAPTNKSPKRRRLDFAILRSRVKHNHYEDFKMFETDFKLMCYSVMRFNEPETLNYVAADELLRYGFRCIGLTAEKHKSEFCPAESSAAVGEQSAFPQSDLEYDKKQRLYAAIMNNNPIVPLRDVLENRGEAAPEEGFDLPGGSGDRTPHSSLLKNRDTTNLTFMLSILLGELEQKDVDQIFSFPVTDDIAPGYSQVITKPMDLSTMRAKMEAVEYSSIREFRADFELMCENAMRYNHVDTVHYKTAKKFLPMGLKRIAMSERVKMEEEYQDYAQANQEPNELEQPQGALTGDGGFECLKCGMVFTAEKWLDTHLKYRHKSDHGKYQCDKLNCTYATDSKGKFLCHQVIHNKPLFKCGECSKMCKNRGNLKKHIQTVHLKLRPYICAICSNAFGENRTLTVHMRIMHTGERPFRCPQCEFTAAHVQSMRHHFKRAHESLQS